MIRAKKELGQNFLCDRSILSTIAGYGELTGRDTVLEIGPGLGVLTAQLCRRAGRVVAVEYDRVLAEQLAGRVAELMGGQPANLELVRADFMDYDLGGLPANYKVVANIPYYLTSKIMEKLWASANQPSLAVILVQREVAQRLAATPGQLSLLAISVQLFARVELGIKVPAELFDPAPKVDSQVVIMHRRSDPLIPAAELERFFTVCRAGFCQRRKKLLSSLALGLRTTKAETARLLRLADINSDRRAQELSIADWQRLTKVAK